MSALTKYYLYAETPGQLRRYVSSDGQETDIYLLSSFGVWAPLWILQDWENTVRHWGDGSDRQDWYNKVASPVVQAIGNGVDGIAFRVKIDDPLWATIPDYAAPGAVYRRGDGWILIPYGATDPRTQAVMDVTPAESGGTVPEEPEYTPPATVPSFDDEPMADGEPTEIEPLPDTGMGLGVRALLIAAAAGVVAYVAWNIADEF